MQYEDVYQRNIGLITQEEQDKLCNAKIAVAGVGGSGGMQAASLARMGVGAMALMDPGIFDPPDMNRQFGAMKSTMDRNKARATAELLHDINPFMKIDIYEEALDTPEAMAEFVHDADAVIEAIDYARYGHAALLAQAARQEGAYLFTSPLPDFGSILIAFAPDGMTYETFHGFPGKFKPNDEFQLDPKRYFGTKRECKNIQWFINKDTPYISTNAGAGALSAALLSTEVAFLICGKRKPGDMVIAPKVTHVDMVTRTFEVFNPLEEAGLL